jgi:hypothetical protein
MDLKSFNTKGLLIIGKLTGINCFHTSTQIQTSKPSLRYEMTVQRACEAAIWAMLPAIGIYGIEASITRDLAGKFGDVVYFRKPMESRHDFLTANDVPPYVTSAQRTKVGPLVVEVPAAGEKASEPAIASFSSASAAPKKPCSRRPGRFSTSRGVDDHG